MMIKVIPPGSHAFSDCASQIIKIASTGLRGNDLAALIKVAGHEFAEKVKRMDFHKGEVPVHLIAMGATEAVGPNRNGDGFKIASCRRYHSTFVKHARWYRNHKNKDPQKSYGIVKTSIFSEPMKRIELLVALNSTKSAADKNGGLVADQEIEKLEKGDEIGVSMACKVAYDVCSSCDNKAKNRSQYCLGTDEGGNCKYGGLKNHIGEVHESGHHIHADNPHPTFFDISMVYRPADRTAYVLGKAASSGIVGGAELAETLGVTAPLEIYDESDYGSDILSQIKIARTLAAKEQSYSPSQWDRAFDPEIFKSHLAGIEVFSNNQRSSLLRAFANEKVALSLMDWLKLTTGASEDKCAEAVSTISPCLSTVFSDLIEEPDLPDLIRNNPCKAASSTTPVMENWVIKNASELKLDRNNIQQRIWLSTMRQNEMPKYNVKAASTSNAAKQLARQYAIYQIGFLHDLSKHEDFDLHCDMLVRQNRVS